MPNTAKYQANRPTVSNGQSLETQICHQAKMVKSDGWLVLINPSRKPKALQLQAMGVNPSHVLMLHPQNRQQFLLALEQSLESTTVKGVIAWRGGLHLHETELTNAQGLAFENKKVCQLIPPQQSAVQNTPTPKPETAIPPIENTSETTTFEALGHLIEETASKPTMPWIENELLELQAQLAS